METWLTRIIKKARGDLTTNPQGLDDGGLSIGGGIHNLMSTESPQESVRRRKKKRNGIHKKVKPNPLDHPGEQEISPM